MTQTSSLSPAVDIQGLDYAFGSDEARKQVLFGVDLEVAGRQPARLVLAAAMPCAGCVRRSGPDSSSNQVPSNIKEDKSPKTKAGTKDIQIGKSQIGHGDPGVKLATPRTSSSRHASRRVQCRPWCSATCLLR